MRHLLVAFLLSATLSQAQTRSGQVRDAQSGELLAGVSVFDSTSGTGTITNTYGFFSLTPTGAVLRFSYVGYTSQYLKLPPEDAPLLIQLEKIGALDEVVVKGNRPSTLQSLSLSLDEIRRMPSLLGEADVLKAFSYTPGVASGHEGSAGLYVRGGTPDQNLILLDEVPVYNAMHLGGFFSVFNPAALKKAELYKSAFPARYGGRLSSIIDLSMKEGNTKKFGGEVGLGLLNQSLLLEGPILKDKASFIVSGRISTLGLSSFLVKKRRQNTSGEDYVYKFHDLNAKVNYALSPKDHVYLSFYNGFDRFKYIEWVTNASNELATTMGNNWGNSTATLRYSRTFSSKLFGRAVLLYSDYTSQFNNAFQDNDGGTYRNSDTRVTDLGLKLQWDYYVSKYLDLRLGGELIQHRFTPFHLSTNYENSSLPSTPGSKLTALQKDLFLDADLRPLRGLTVNAGLRFAHYGLETKNFANLEPRLSAAYALNPQWKVQGSYTRMNQYLHLLVNNGYGFGYDAWVPATAKIPPSRAGQYSLGVSWEKKGLELTLEAYRKRISNTIDYPEGTNFTSMLADSWEELVKSGGRGRVQGLELMGSKNTGKLRGRVSYTWSRSELRFEGINEGKWYPMKYDRRHNLNFSLAYHFNAKWSMNSTFIYQTGHAVTLPVSAVLYNDVPRFIYGDKHGSRMPDFHRLDLGFSRNGKIWGKRATVLSFGLYNAYNRANPLYLDFSTQHNHATGQKTLVLKQYSMFPILPFINYTVKF
jgi:outer membrane cobalamin receptor